MIKMAKVTYLHDLITRQFQQTVDLDPVGGYGLFTLARTRKQKVITGRTSKVVKQLVDLEWEAMLRPTSAPDTFSVGYGEDSQ